MKKSNYNYSNYYIFIKCRQIVATIYDKRRCKLAKNKREKEMGPKKTFLSCKSDEFLLAQLS